MEPILQLRLAVANSLVGQLEKCNIRVPFVKLVNLEACSTFLCVTEADVGRAVTDLVPEFLNFIFSVFDSALQSGFGSVLLFL